MAETEYRRQTTKSYADALQTRFNRAPAKTTAGLLAQNDQQTKLRNRLFALMKQHPEGLTLPQVRLGCPDLVNPLVLNSYPSTRQLLGSLTDVVRLQGIGVQTLVLPASRQNTDGKET